MSKSQLAAKLIERDPEKARNEVEEIENISRTSLAQVREAVSGYRQRDLATELVRARVLLDSLEIQVKEDIVPVDTLDLSQQHNTALAYIVRELTTNIMRHANADNCQISLQKQGNTISLAIKDDGHAPSSLKEGSGLKGIRERIQDLGGRVDYQIDNGFQATITLTTP